MAIHRLPSILPQNVKFTRPRRSYRWAGYLIIGLILTAIYWFIYLSPTFAVETVEVAGIDAISVKTATDRIVGRNIFRLNATSLEQEMRQVYPPIGRVSLARGLPHVVRLNITLRTPKLRWQVNDTTYILDEQGEIFTEGDAPIYANLPKLVDKSGISRAIGDRIVSGTYIDFISEIGKAAPEKFQRPLVALEITETTLHVDAVFEGDLRLRLTTQRPSTEQIDSGLSLYLAHRDAKVIDVRVPRWGYYKK